MHTFQYKITCNINTKSTFFSCFHNLRKTQSILSEKQNSIHWLVIQCCLPKCEHVWVNSDESYQIKLCPYISGTAFKNRLCHKITWLLVANTDLEVKSCCREQNGFTWTTTPTLNTNNKLCQSSNTVHGRITNNTLIIITITMASDPQYYSHQVISSTSHPLKHKITVAVIYTILCTAQVYLQERNMCFLWSRKNRADKL